MTPSITAQIPTRLFRGVVDHFQGRALSWFSAGILSFASMNVSGWLSVACFLIAVVRVSSLVVNGTFPKYPVASYLRVLSLVAAALVWAQLAFVFNNAGGDSTFSVGVCAIMIIADMVNTIYAAQDL